MIRGTVLASNGQAGRGLFVAMGGYSHNTQKLQELARKLDEMKVEESVTETIEELNIKWSMWPLLAVAGSASGYGDLRQAAEDASTGLDQAVTGLGKAIDAIADYYKRQEERYGSDWDALGAEGE